MAHIGIQRHLFIEAFTYDLKARHKPKKAFKEITHLIPGVSAIGNSIKFVDSFKDRMKWESEPDMKRFSFDEEFSNYRLLRYLVHAMGIGILFVPVRIAATYMKTHDEKQRKTCPYDSPYHPSLKSNYVSPPNFKKPTDNQMFDFEPLRKYGIDPDQMKKDVINRIEFNRWKSTQNR